jgi:hypothetical protein
MKNDQAQREIIAAAFFAINSRTALPSAYEQLLADNYIAGSSSINKSVELLEEYRHRQVGQGH